MSKLWRRPLLLALGLILIVGLGFVLGRNSTDAPLGGGGSPADAAKKLVLDLVAPPKDRATPADATQAAVLIESPADGSTVPDHFNVAGRAKSDVGPLVVSVRDAIGSLISVADAAIANPEAGSAYGRFGATLELRGYQGQLQLEVVAKSNPSTTLVRRSLRAGATAAAPSTGDASSLGISVFYSKGAPLDCSVVQPVARTIDADKNAYREALAALLAGPSADEKSDGYTTSIPAAAKVRSVNVNAAGTVTVDFDEGIQRGVAGSCRVGAIRAQIERTLRQFPEVREVVISVRGDTETVLQP